MEKGKLGMENENFFICLRAACPHRQAIQNS
jgi:hypothetical protein